MIGPKVQDKDLSKIIKTWEFFRSDPSRKVDYK